MTLCTQDLVTGDLRCTYINPLYTKCTQNSPKIRETVTQPEVFFSFGGQSVFPFVAGKKVEGSVRVVYGPQSVK